MSSLDVGRFVFTDLIDPVKIANPLTSSTRLFLKIKPIEFLFTHDKSKTDETPNVKMVDSFNFLSEFCVSWFTKTPEKHHETLIPNTIALLNVFLQRDQNDHAILRDRDSFYKTPNIARLAANVGAPALTRRWEGPPEGQ